jgi:hypothetical protein
MTVQFLIVSMVVGLCFVYSAWSLMPQAGRRAVSTGLLLLPLPDQLAIRLQVNGRKPACGDCDGCDRATAASAFTHVVRFHPPQVRASTCDASHVR